MFFASSFSFFVRISSEIKSVADPKLSITSINTPSFSAKSLMFWILSFAAVWSVIRTISFL